MNGWVIFIFCLAILVILLISAPMPTNDNTSKVGSKPKENTIRSRGKYIAGLPDKLSGKEFYIDIFNNYVELFFVDGRITHKIPWEDIQDVRIVSQEHVKNEVSLGRLAVFGVFALAMKKNKEEYKNMLQLTHKYQGEIVSSIYIIKTESDLMKIVNYLRSLIRESNERKTV